MKIIEQTPSQLTVEHKPTNNWKGGLIYLIILLAILSFISVIPIHSTLTCQKVIFDRVNCQIKESSLFQPKLTTRSMDNLVSANNYFVNKDSIELKTAKNFLLLPISEQSFYFPNDTWLMGSAKLREKQTEEINTFINNSSSEEKNLKLEEHFNVFWLIYLLCFLVYFCYKSFQAFLAPIKIYLFDKTVGKLIVNHKFLFTTYESAQHSLEEISAIESDRQDNSYLVTISCNSGDHKYILGDFDEKQKAEAAIKRIDEFLTEK